MKNKIDIWESRSGLWHNLSYCTGGRDLKRREITKQDLVDKGYLGVCRCLRERLIAADGTTWRERAREKESLEKH